MLPGDVLADLTAIARERDRLARERAALLAALSSPLAWTGAGELRTRADGLGTIIASVDAFLARVPRMSDAVAAGDLAMVERLRAAARGILAMLGQTSGTQELAADVRETADRIASEVRSVASGGLSLALVGAGAAVAWLLFGRR